MNRLFLVALCGILGCFTAQAAKEKQSCNDGTCVKVLGQSGKFYLYRMKQNETEGCTITFDAIKELDKDMNEVGKSGSKESKHSFNNFAQLDFTFTELENRIIKGLEASCFNFSAMIPGPNATLNVPTCLFKDNGTITLCDGLEEFSILMGMMKFNIEISQWTFCGDGVTCKKNQTDEVGKYIEFSINVKCPGKASEGKKGNAKEKHEAQKIYFGNNTSFAFPENVEADGNCTKMPNDYPKMKQAGSAYKMTFVFPKFKKYLIFDPVGDVNAVREEGGSGQTTSEPTTTGIPTTKPNMTTEATTTAGGDAIASSVLALACAILMYVVL